MRPCGAQQRRGRRRRGAELAGQIEHRAALRQRQAHDQAEFAGNAGRRRLVPDLRQLVGAVEHEVAHAMPRPRLADGAARLDRVHEVDVGVGEHLPHQRAPRRSRRSRNARTPPARTARSIAGSGLHFTAYSTSPGNASTKSRAVASTVAGRRQCIGSSGRSAATSSSTAGSARGIGGKRRRRGETAERTRRLVHGGNPREHAGARERRADGRDKWGTGAGANAPRRRTQPVLRGLRIAANRSANIGGSLTTPAHA